MADLFNLGNLGVTDGGFDGSGLKTGDIRRKYNFGDRFSEPSIASDPFFRFLSMASKKPTDDPSFKFTDFGVRTSRFQMFTFSNIECSKCGCPIVHFRIYNTELTIFNVLNIDCLFLHL